MQKKRRHTPKRSRPKARGEGLEERVSRLEKKSVWGERLKDAVTGAAMFGALISGKATLQRFGEIIKERSSW